MKNNNPLLPELRFPEFKNDGEWEEKKIEDIFKTFSGGTPNTSEKEYYNGEIPFIRSAEINKDKTELFLSEAGLKNSSAKMVSKGDLLIALYGANSGDSAISKINGAINQAILCLKSEVSNSFTNNYLTLKKEWIVTKFVQGGQGNLSADIIKSIQINIPKNPLEQQKIADCLSSLDALLEAHQEKLSTLQKHKKGLLQNLFPQERERFPKIRFGNFSEPLNKISFSEIGDIKIGLTHKPNYINTGVPFLSSKNISGGYIDFKNIQYISKEKFESMPNSTKPKVGDILFTRVGSNLGNPIILEEDIEFGIFVSLGFFRVNEKANNYYIKYWMESDLFWKQVNQKVGGGAKDNLNSTWLKEFELYLPSIIEQQKIADTLSSLDDLINAQTQKIAQLQNHKKGLLQGLFPKIKE